MARTFYIKAAINYILSKMKKAAKISILIVSVVMAIIALFVGFMFLLIEPSVNILGAPDLDLAKLTSASRTITLTDVDGKPINDVLYDSNKIFVDIDDISEHTKNAFIAVEDKRFYSHGGIDYRRIASAALANIKSGKFREGASTITQQLIKNTHLSNEKTIRRKLNEMRLARALERVYDKDAILENYFNILYFGSGIKGLGTASRVMFGISASELTLAQSAALASIINNPTKYSPYDNYDNLIERKNLVLKLMLDQGLITDSDYKSARAEELTFDKNKQNQFVSGVLRAVCRSIGCSEKELFSTNRTISTYYNAEIAACARRAINDMGEFNGYIRLLVLDNASGGIICDETNSNKYIDLRRSPASAIKPFVSYAAALESGYNPMSQILDEPTVFGDYEPHNYKDSYRGYTSLHDCLIYSSNIAAVKLLQSVGIDKGAATARLFGLTVDAEDDSLALTLGGMKNGVTLSELANAYRTLANGGIYTDIRYFDAVDGNRHGNFPYSRRAVGDDTAYLLTDMLKDCARNGTARKLKNVGVIAAKTGTNGDKNGNTDCYCIAYTPQYTIAVWYGAKDKPIDNKITGAACANMIKTLCDGAIKTDMDFTVPDSVAYYEIDDRELRETHEVYLADPFLPKRYRRRALMSKKRLPVRKNIDYLDYFDNIFDFGGIRDKFLFGR